MSKDRNPSRPNVVVPPEEVRIPRRPSPKLPSPPPPPTHGKSQFISFVARNASTGTTTTITQPARDPRDHSKRRHSNTSPAPALAGMSQTAAFTAPSATASASFSARRSSSPTPNDPRRAMTSAISKSTQAPVQAPVKSSSSPTADAGAFSIDANAATPNTSVSSPSRPNRHATNSTLRATNAVAKSSSPPAVSVNKPNGGPLPERQREREVNEPRPSASAQPPVSSERAFLSHPRRLQRVAESNRAAAAQAKTQAAENKPAPAAASVSEPTEPQGSILDVRTPRRGQSASPRKSVQDSVEGKARGHTPAVTPIAAPPRRPASAPARNVPTPPKQAVANSSPLKARAASVPKPRPDAAISPPRISQAQSPARRASASPTAQVNAQSLAASRCTSPRRTAGTAGERQVAAAVAAAAAAAAAGGPGRKQAKPGTCGGLFSPPPSTGTRKMADNTPPPIAPPAKKQRRPRTANANAAAARSKIDRARAQVNETNAALAREVASLRHISARRAVSHAPTSEIKTALDRRTTSSLRRASSQPIVTPLQNAVTRPQALPPAPAPLSAPPQLQARHIQPQPHSQVPIQGHPHVPVPAQPQQQEPRRSDDFSNSKLYSFLVKRGKKKNFAVAPPPQPAPAPIPPPLPQAAANVPASAQAPAQPIGQPATQVRPPRPQQPNAQWQQVNAVRGTMQQPARAMQAGVQQPVDGGALRQPATGWGAGIPLRQKQQQMAMRSTVLQPRPPMPPRLAGGLVGTKRKLPSDADAVIDVDAEVQPPPRKRIAMFRNQVDVRPRIRRNFVRPNRVCWSVDPDKPRLSLTHVAGVNVYPKKQVILYECLCDTMDVENAPQEYRIKNQGNVTHPDILWQWELLVHVTECPQADMKKLKRRLIRFAEADPEVLVEWQK